MLGLVLRGASRSKRLRGLIVAAPATRRVVNRFVGQLVACGLTATIDHLGEDVTTAAEATASRDAYLRAIDAISAAALGQSVEVSVKLSAFGQALPGGHDIALANAEAVAAAAAGAGTTVTLDMESSGTVDSTLAVLGSLRTRHPETGAVLQSCLFRTPGDVRALATEESRVRLVKGAYREPPQIAHQDKRAVDAAYRQCLGIMMSGPGYGYFVRRLAERPANLQFFVRSLTTRD